MPKEPMNKPTFSGPNEALLRKMGGDTKHLLDPARGVYTNRDLNLQTISHIGFDMDYTLAIYKKLPMEQLQYDLTVERLINAHHYPESIRELQYDPSFIIRGLLVDKHTGHLIKINSHNQVWRASFGRRQVLIEDIQAHYQNEKIRLGDPRYASLDTLFAMPEACLFANLVDFFQDRLLRGSNLKPLQITKSDSPCQAVGFDTEKLFNDVRESIDAIHRDGSLKAIITADITTYIEDDPDLPLMLHKFRSSGKKLFLMTNSYWAYTREVMKYLLDNKLQAYPDWQSYFDTVIVGSKKPAFFSDRRPFLQLDTTAPGDGTPLEETVTQLERGQIYQGGNIRDFEDMTGIQGTEVLYVGDHIYGDILRSKKDSLWRTCLIVEELEQEIHGVLRWAFDVEKLSALDSERQETDSAIGRHRALLARMENLSTNPDFNQKGSTALTQEETEELAKTIKNFNFEIDHAKRYLKYLDRMLATHTDELERRFNPYWGRLLKEHNELSRFGAQVAWYACTYTSRASNFLRFSPVHRFKATRDTMNHDAFLSETLSMRQVRQSSGTIPPLM